MSMLKRPAFAWSIAVLAVVAIAVGGTLVAETQGLRAFSGGPVAEPLTQELPPLTRGPMTITHDAERALSILSFDDGTCESGLGAGTTQAVTDLVDFDVPTQCTQAGLEVVGVTAKLNTGQFIQNFAYAQSGAAPPPAGGLGLVPITTILAGGPCPTAQTLVSRAVSPAAVINGTANFFAGVQAFGFAARDTNGPPAGRIWLLCSFCGMTQYTPTTLSTLGLGGNWMIRVTVEDANCVPVELMQFTIS